MPVAVRHGCLPAHFRSGVSLLALAIGLAVAHPRSALAAPCGSGSDETIASSCDGPFIWTGGGLTNSATISGGSVGVQASPNNLGTLTNSGTITGTAAGFDTSSYNISISGIINQGTITGGQDGIYADAASFGTISNGAFGTISGSRSGLYFTAYSSGVSALNNQGVITGGSYGLYVDSDAAIRALTNSGLIRGGQYAIYDNSSGGLGAITNTGEIAGNIYSAHPLTINGGTGSAFGTLIGYDGVSKGTISGDVIFNTGNTHLNDDVGGTVTVNRATLKITDTINIGGQITVNGGVFDVDGTITGTPGVTVNSGGTLTGSGTIDPLLVSINSGAIFSPGNGTPGTSTTIVGNLAFQSGALYLVQVNPTSATSANVTGGATLGGSVQVVLAPGGYSIRSYDILHAAGGFGGTTFSGLNLSNPNFSASLSYTPTDVFLNLTGATLGAGIVLNQNQQNVANALNNFFNTGGTLPPNFASIFASTGGALANALTQLDGEAATGAERAVFQLTNEFLNLMLDPFVNGRVGDGAIGLAPAQQTSLPHAAILNKAPPSLPFEQRWTAWGSGFGGSNTAHGDSAVGSSNVTARTYGFAGGMDYHLSPATVAGFALAGAGANWGLANALGSGRSDAFQAGAYSVSWFGPAYLAGGLAFSNHWFTTSRLAPGDQLSANFVGQSYGARLEGGYRLAVLPVLAVTPYGAVQFQDFHMPAYRESDPTGGGFGLSYNAMDATDTRTELGSRFDAPTLLYGKPLVLYGRVAWAHDFVSNPALSAAFESLPGAAFTVFGAPISHDAALTTAGAQLFIFANWSLIAKFDGEFAPTAQTYAGSGTLRYSW